jgi:signal transduction histidine kinase
MKIKTLLTFVSLQILTLLLLQWIFGKVQYAQSIAAGKAVASLLREEENQGNPELIARTIEDMENAGLLKCSRLIQIFPYKKEQLDLRYRSDCTDHLITLSGGKHSVKLQSLNGARWDFQFATVNGQAFDFGLWLSRILIIIAYSGTLITYLRDKKKREHLRTLERNFYKSILEISTQVAHDIRSPLAALSMAERDLETLPEETRIILRSAISRIQDIASQLMHQASAASEVSSTTDEASTTEPTLLSSVIETILAEKRMQYRSRLGITIDSQLSPTAQASFANVQPREFKRIISNLINNSVEAMKESGRISLSLTQSADSKTLTLEIRDTGKGIPPEILSQLGTRGFSHGKTGGSGLGLHHAQSCLETWGGSLQITSTPETGTIVALQFPVCPPPDWFLPALELDSNSHVIILDDDQSIHQVWQGRMESANATASGISLIHFSTPQQLQEWFQARTELERTRPSRYLIDYEIIGSPETGLDLIQKLGIESDSVLVTSRYEEPRIRKRCEELSLKLLPKALAGFVSISIKNQPLRNETNGPDAILLDDDPLVHTTWNWSARHHKINLKIYSDAPTFLSELSSIPKTTPIYIDSSLGKQTRGEDILLQLSKLGYEKLTLATGYHPDQFLQKLKDVPGFQGVRDKTPPW